MKIKQTSKKIVEQKKEIQVVRIEETIDELGNVIPAHDEEVEVIINITDDVTEEVEVKDEILSFENKTSDKAEPTPPTQEERLEALEGAFLEMILGGAL